MTIDRELVTRKLLLVTADIESLGAFRDKASRRTWAAASTKPSSSAGWNAP